MSRWRGRTRRALILAGGATAVLALIAGVAMTAGIVPVGQFERFGVTLSAAIGVVHVLLVVVIAGVGLWILRDETESAERFERLTASDQPPETPQRAPQLVGAAFDETVAAALRDVRLKNTPFEQTDPQQTLYETAHSGLKLVSGYDDAAAEELLTAGEWTADPIAAAFLGDSVAYPIRFQLLRWARPGAAYEHAIARTTRAVTRLLADELARDAAPTLSAIPDDAPEPGLVGRLRDELQARIEAVRDDTTTAGPASRSQQPSSTRTREGRTDPIDPSATNPTTDPLVTDEPIERDTQGDTATDTEPVAEEAAIGDTHRSERGGNDDV